MTRQEFIGKTTGAINKDNANQVYTLLCNLVDTAAPADDTKYTLTEAQYKYVNESLVCIYNNDVVGVMRSIRNMIALGKGYFPLKIGIYEGKGYPYAVCGTWTMYRQYDYRIWTEHLVC